MLPSSLTTKLSAKDLFDKYDIDKSGKISLTEFQNMLPDLGIHLSIPKQIEYFRLWDKDGNGQIDYEEFKVALFICDTEEVNHAGFNAGTILRPKGMLVVVLYIQHQRFCQRSWETDNCILFVAFFAFLPFKTS